MLVCCLILALSSASNINCVDSSCSSCTSGYLYKSLSCLPLCPTGYTQSANPSICTATSSQNIFFLRFWEFRQFAATSIGNFQHPTGLQFQNSAKGSPIPTMERGFYFVSTSKLKSTVNYIIGPDFSLRLCIRIKADGTILEATSGGISYFKLSAVAGQVIAYWYLTSTSTSATYSVTGITYTTNWALINVHSSQSTGVFTISNSGNTSTLNNFEFRGEVSDLLIYFGGDTTASFTGFLDEIYADNSVITLYNKFPPWITCEYNEYFNTDSDSCLACTGCSSTWPWCTRGGCEICYSSLCSACTGYTWQYCTSCISTETAPNCILGQNCAAGTEVFACTSCNIGYILIDGLCLYEPYGYNAGTLLTPVIDITFNTFAQYYGPFQSGSDASTYGPWNNPDADDPIPVNSRGLYFDGLTKYLVSTSNVALNYKSSIAMWFYPKSGMVMSTYNFYFYAGGYGRIYLSNPDEAWYLYTTSYQPYFNQWIFGAYTINFSSNTLTVAYTLARQLQLFYP